MNQTDLSRYVSDFVSLPKATTLLREEGLRCFLLHLKASEEMPEHKTRGAITVQCLQGQVLFVEGDDKVDLTPGVVISVAGNAPHSVIARLDSLLLITVSE